VSSIKQRQSAPGTLAETVLLTVALGTITVGLGLTWVATHLAAAIDHHAAPPASPFAVVFGLADGTLDWTPTATKVLVVLLTAVLAMAALTTFGVVRWRRRAARADRAATRMGHGPAIAPLSRKTATATATRLGIGGEPGIKIGRTVNGGADLYQDWESVSIDVWGPRAGKTTSRAIPAIIAAPGAVVATSNKRDLVDATRDLRAAKGRVWIFDPQGIADETPTWWWNPLSYVTDENKAKALADVFASAARKPDARTDAYFDAAAVDLLANLLLASARAGRTITQVYLWLTEPNDDEPAQILHSAGYHLPAAAVRGVVGAPEKQRAGIYGTAQQIASFLTNRQALTWVTPGLNISHELKPADFVRTSDTLYSLSREGHGNAGPLVTALTVAICEAAEEHAATQPHGRLPVPMVAVLDEAANVCRWTELPNLYSHYGSRGINVMTFLQSWSQGTEVWGHGGMRKLWSAANVKVYGGGVSEVEFLDEIGRLIGEYQHPEASVTFTRGSGRSTSHQHRNDRILDVADLAALDRGRMIVMASGAVPVLAKPQPWYSGPEAKAVSSSIAAHTVAPSRQPNA
jgi:type IV secretory pathway TraG/TraD family ATPase VirD4